MIISFSVENFKSIRNEVTLNLIPSPAIKDHEDFVIKTDNAEVSELLPVIPIYGANGSGKSTFIRSLGFMKNFVLTSAKENTHGDKINVEPFLLDKNSPSKPSTFTISFIADDEIRYTYKFSTTTERVTYETLHAFPKGTKQVWFERIYTPHSKSYEWKYSSHFRGDKIGIAEKTLENTLFLSKAVMDNDEQLKTISDFFRNKLAISYNQHDSHLTYEYFKDPEKRKKILAFLNAADLGIDEITVEQIETPQESLPPELRGSGTRYMTYNTKSHHNIPGTNEVVSFSLERNESTGTIKLFRMAGLIIKTLSTGGALIVDELEHALHYKLQCFLVELFNNSEKNPKHAQLIFSTHSALLIDHDLLRRDQIWFTSKTDEKNTTLYSLVDVPKNVKKGKPVRKGQDLVKGFLQGRFYDPPKIKTDQLSLFD